MRIALYGKLTRNTRLDLLAEFFAYLEQAGVTHSIFSPYATELAAADKNDLLSKYLDKRFQTIEEIEKANFLYSLGGDGTLLDALRFSAKTELPIVGVNLGRLGFLTTGSQEEILAITERILAGNWRLEERTMLEVHSSKGELFGESNVGLNDLTIHKSSSNEMIVVHTYINGEFLNRYWTDGLIISTPTGSTAYSLACGGPIMMPRANVFLVTPIAPHSLTVRPFILPDDAVLSFQLESRSGSALVALDSRTEVVPDSVEISVQKASCKARLVKTGSPSYFSTLRSRLNWGLDVRN
jgi:NAD+ kinase